MYATWSGRYGTCIGTDGGGKAIYHQYSDPVHSVWDMYRTPGSPFGIGIGSPTLRVGSVSCPIHSVWHLYRIPCTPCGICIWSHTVRMGSVSGPMQSAWDPYRIPYTPYGICVGFHAFVCHMHRTPCAPYRLCIGSRTLRTRSVSDRLQSVLDLG